MLYSRENTPFFDFMLLAYPPIAPSCYGIPHGLVLKCRTQVLTKVFLHDLPHTTTSPQKMVLKFLGIFSEIPPNFTGFLISPSCPLQLLFRIAMPTVLQNYEVLWPMAESMHIKIWFQIGLKTTFIQYILDGTLFYKS